MQTLANKVVSKIKGSGKGIVFSPNLFADLGDARSVGMALSRLTADGTIRRLAHGLYDYPKTHPTLGVLLPSADAVAKALAGKDQLRLQPAGAYAANLLGLSDQVPLKVVFLTDGPSKKVRVGKQEIVLKRTTPRNMATAGKVSGVVIQALRHLGQEHVDDDVVARLRQRLGPDDKRWLQTHASLAPAWIAKIMRRVATVGN